MQPVLDFLKNLFATVWGFDGVKFITLHVLINVVVAVAAALKTKQFDLSKIGAFLVQKLMPYVTIYVVIKLFGDEVGLTALAPMAWAIITATLLGDLGDSLAQLGMNLPTSIRNIVVKGASK